MLTDTQCRAARPREKAYKLADGGGLVPEAQRNRAKALSYVPPCSPRHHLA